ncbi:MAG: DNA polymerase III subunit epsilon, partial [Flavobacteriaceae bacterium]|nr:DNA polymerase III subunit epsilon [Flavobacteriaceae bacterium]
YDYRVLKNELKSCKINYNSKTICTIEMARQSYKDLKYYNLNFLCNYFDIELINHHRALDDATATLNLFKKLKD